MVSVLNISTLCTHFQALRCTVNICHRSCTCPREKIAHAPEFHIDLCRYTEFRDFGLDSYSGQNQETVLVNYIRLSQPNYFETESREALLEYVVEV